MDKAIIIRDEHLRGTALKRILELDLSKAWEVTVKPYKRSRSVEQNALYWLQLGVLAKETGHSADELHEVAKLKFLLPTFVEIDGEVHEIRRSTTKLNIAEMAEYLTQFQAWAATDLGVNLPFPEDRWAA